MIRLLRKRRKNDSDRLFVDLGEYAADMAAEEYGMVVKTVDMKLFSDLTIIADLISREWLIIVETSKFEEGEAVRREAMEKMKIVAKDRGGRFFEISERVAVIAPLHIKVEKCRIRRNM